MSPFMLTRLYGKSPTGHRYVFITLYHISLKKARAFVKLGMDFDKMLCLGGCGAEYLVWQEVGELTGDLKMFGITAHIRGVSCAFFVQNSLKKMCKSY